MSLATYGVELAFDVGAILGEAPVWDQGVHELLWLDIPAKILHRCADGTGAHRTMVLEETVTAVAPRTMGGLVAASRRGFSILEPDSGALATLANVNSGRAGFRMSDGKCDPSGRFWAGSIAEDPTQRTGSGALYRLDCDHRVSCHVTGVSISNGLGWSPDGRLMYFIDTAAQGIDVFDYEPTGGLPQNRRRLITVPAGWGRPDGMTVDADGCLWVALMAGWRVCRYTPAGQLIGEVNLPVAQVTSCTFGGDDLGDLFITTAARGLDERGRLDQPGAGGLFISRPGVVGTPPFVYCG
jgi:sugar lactone lactonase YvrE